MAKIFVAIFALVCSSHLASSLIYDTPLKTQSDDYYITKETAKVHFRSEFLKLIKTRKSEHPRYKEQYVVAANLLELMNVLRFMDEAGAILEISLSEVSEAFVTLAGIDYVDAIYQKLVEKLKSNKSMYDEYQRLEGQTKHQNDVQSGKSIDDSGNPVWIRAVLANCFLMETKKPALSPETRFKQRRDRILVAHLVADLAKDSAKEPALQKLYESVIADVAKDYANSYSILTDEASKLVLEMMKLKLEADPQFSEDLQLALGKKDAPKKA